MMAMAVYEPVRHQKNIICTEASELEMSTPYAGALGILLLMNEKFVGRA
jgi:hypothetical protein